MDRVSLCHSTRSISPSQIIAGRNIVKAGRGIPSPFVEVEISGEELDSHHKHKTATKSKNQFPLLLWIYDSFFQIQ